MPKTAYELEREAKVARNRALIEQLELKSAAASLAPGPTTKPKAPPKSKAKPVQPIKREKRIVDDAPRRVSARLRRGMADPNETPTQKRKREQEEETRRRREEEERLASEERAREAKKPRHGELDLETLAGQEEWEPGALTGLSSKFQTLLQARNPRRASSQDAFVFEDDKSEAAEVSALRERFQNLKVVARAKVTQDRVYSAAYHPDPTTDLIFFGDKHGQLGIWDARAPADDVGEDDDIDADLRETGKYWRLQAHWPATSRSSISCIKFDPIDAHSVYTSSYDGTVRSLSFTSGISREVFAMENVLITSMDIPPASHEMWISDAEGWVSHLDLREDKSKRRAYQLSDQKIGTVSVNPTNPAFLLTASNNRTLKVWDVRKLQNLPARNGVLELGFEEIEQLDKPKKVTPATLRVGYRHDKAVTSAHWDPRGRSIVSTCYDDVLRLWDVPPSFMTNNAPFPNFYPQSRVQHNCQTGKWVTLLKAQWSQDPDVYPHFTIGDMDHTLDIFGCKGELLAKLSDPTKISATQAVTCSHPSIVEHIASGNATGRCVLWAPADDDDDGEVEYVE